MSDPVPLKPTDEEIARVDQWRKHVRFVEVQIHLEDLYAKAKEHLHFAGEVIDLRFSKEALLGVIYANRMDLCPPQTNSFDG